jgi:hypothetical protein
VVETGAEPRNNAAQRRVLPERLPALATLPLRDEFPDASRLNGKISAISRPKGDS